MTIAGKPQTNEYAPYYQRYVDLAPDDDIVGALDAQARETATLLAGLNDEQASFRYAPDKWSVKQIVGHMIDGERIFAFRALAIARGETQALPGFDQDPYVVNGGADERSIADLTEELATVRKGNVMMMRGFSADAWQRAGTASDNRVSARAIAYIMLGHERHHLRVLRERYLGGATAARIA